MFVETIELIRREQNNKQVRKEKLLSNNKNRFNTRIPVQLCTSIMAWNTRFTPFHTICARTYNTLWHTNECTIQTNALLKAICRQLLEPPTAPRRTKNSMEWTCSSCNNERSDCPTILRSNPLSYHRAHIDYKPFSEIMPITISIRWQLEWRCQLRAIG